MLAAELLHRNAGVHFLQEANDLFFCESLLHVQSPLSRYWTPKGGATQIRGDVVPSPTPFPGENSESFLSRVPTESLRALVDEYYRQKRESS